METEVFMKRMFEELKKDNWGMIDPWDFVEGSDYYDDLKNIIERVVNGPEST